VNQIAFIGHNLDVTDALKDLVNTKFKKIKRHFDNITSAHVTFTIEKLENIAEATIHVPGHQLHAKAKSADMYKSIDKMMQDLDRQVIKHKEKISNHRD
jgi:putative sigma-54 modulation protein